jgi:hypothetical protein
MLNRKNTVFAVVALLSLLAINVNEASAQEKVKKDKTIPRGVAVLWTAPTDISSRDLYLGPGGAAMRPDLREVTFLEEDKGGYSGTKYRIRDASGREWVAKIGKEAQSETAAVRLLWAAGYETEINYLVRNLTIPGKGTFQDVRLEARPENEKRLEEWKWKQNRFVGRREFQGLKVMMQLLENWDIKDSNNDIIQVKGTNRLRYIISDLGATFGKTGGIPLVWVIRRSRSEPSDFEDAGFIDGVDGNRVKFDYNGKMKGIFDDVTVADARWLGNWLSRLSRRQISDAFRAANYTPEEINTLTDAVRDRIAQLRSLRPERVRRYARTR